MGVYVLNYLYILILSFTHTHTHTHTYSLSRCGPFNYPFNAAIIKAAAVIAATDIVAIIYILYSVIVAI